MDSTRYAVRISCGMTQQRSAKEINRITATIIESAIRIHRTVGPGILEKAYFGCLCYELASAELKMQTQKELPLLYHGVRIDCAYRADLILEETVVGLLLNFGALTMKQGIKRVVNNFKE